MQQHFPVYFLFVINNVFKRHIFITFCRKTAATECIFIHYELNKSIGLNMNNEAAFVYLSFGYILTFRSNVASISMIKLPCEQNNHELF